MFVGLSTLLFGARVAHAQDWDNNVSLLMAGLTYLLMPMFDRALKRWNFLYAFLIGDFCAHSAYCLYWGLYDPSALVMIPANYPASWSLFLLCWLVWCPFVEVFERHSRKRRLKALL